MSLLSTLHVMYTTFRPQMPFFALYCGCPMPIVRHAPSARSPTMSDTETSFTGTPRVFCFLVVFVTTLLGCVFICRSSVFFDPEFLLLRAGRPTLVGAISCT